MAVNRSYPRNKYFHRTINQRREDEAEPQVQGTTTATSDKLYPDYGPAEMENRTDDEEKDYFDGEQGHILVVLLSFISNLLLPFGNNLN